MLGKNFFFIKYYLIASGKLKIFRPTSSFFELQTKTNSTHHFWSFDFCSPLMNWSQQNFGPIRKGGASRNKIYILLQNFKIKKYIFKFQNSNCVSLLDVLHVTKNPWRAEIIKIYKKNNIGNIFFSNSYRVQWPRQDLRRHLSLRGQMSILYGAIPIPILIMAFVNSLQVAAIEADIICHQAKRIHLICHITQPFHQVNYLFSVQNIQKKIERI